MSGADFEAGRLPTRELDLRSGGRVDLSGDESIDLLVRKAVADIVGLIEKARKRREAKGGCASTRAQEVSCIRSLKVVPRRGEWSSMAVKPI